MVLRYESPIGTIRIVRIQESEYAIVIDGMQYGGHASEVAAADAVYHFQTGCDKWDALSDDDETLDDVPPSIGEWDWD